MAERVFEGLGDQLTKALLSADFDLYRSIMTLPVTFTPRGAKAYTLSDDAALRDDFDLYVSIIRLHGVTDIYRLVLGTDAVSADEMVVQCKTHILVRARLLVDPFETRMRLLRQDDRWRISGIESSIGHLNWAMGRADVLSDGQFENRGV